MLSKVVSSESPHGNSACDLWRLPCVSEELSLPLLSFHYSGTYLSNLSFLAFLNIHFLNSSRLASLEWFPQKLPTSGLLMYAQGLEAKNLLWFDQYLTLKDSCCRNHQEPKSLKCKKKTHTELSESFLLMCFSMTYIKEERHLSGWGLRMGHSLTL